MTREPPKQAARSRVRPLASIGENIPVDGRSSQQSRRQSGTPWRAEVSIFCSMVSGSLNCDCCPLPDGVKSPVSTSAKEDPRKKSGRSILVVLTVKLTVS